ncbi:hypothetical protein GCM10008090_29940 [Arenicella chitinivorans]|uniref:THIF-type NAD/FAD binding fold domain-containing protein n=1 Tax=Arenicella chitinivorans TaxID=1329800 RepID=A0A918VRC5_9GAMM|nr:HesA/MoeB/ThiF family protein [Arenicella chitinivorans]GHA18370.1 hypothetical protein GCM10008090_29940 [Arenicella chitinivorans]
MNARYQRYQRQITVEQIGLTGQQALANSRVLLVGLGGLGCVVASQLVGAGIGEVTLVEHDCVDISNLHRQHLYREQDAGKPKVEVAHLALQALNSDVHLTRHNTRIHPGNALELADGVDLIIDAADNFGTSYLLSDASTQLGIPLLSASVNKTFGYLGLFGAQWPSLRAVFPRIPTQQQGCNEVGVTGPSVGLLANLQAQEAIKLLTHQPTLGGRLLYLDCWQYDVSIVDVSAATEPTGPRIDLISQHQLQDSDYVIDVRSEEEVQAKPQPFVVHSQQPLASSQPLRLPADCHRVVLACQTGHRAIVAGQQLLNTPHADTDYPPLAALLPS